MFVWSLDVGASYAPQLRSCALKIELVDVVFIEDEGLAEEDIVALDLHFAEATGFEGGCAGLEFAFGESGGGFDGEVAEVNGFPQDDGLGDAVFDVSSIFAGKAEADDFDGAGFASLFDGFGSPRNRWP
jgi:hypothetical protein